MFQHQLDMQNRLLTVLEFDYDQGTYYSINTENWKLSLDLFVNEVKA